jgi:hypothetical protein
MGRGSYLLPLANGLKIIDFSGQSSSATASLFITYLWLGLFE